MQGISLCFTGQATIEYVQTGTKVSKERVLIQHYSFPCLPVLRNGQTRKLQETGILEKTWDFVKPDKGHTYTLAAGNYEYPFQYIVPGNVPESIETLRSGWVIYRLKATIERGRFAKDVYARKHVRVVRTFDPSSLEIVHNMVSRVTRARGEIGMLTRHSLSSLSGQTSSLTTSPLAARRSYSAHKFSLTSSSFPC